MNRLREKKARKSFQIVSFARIESQTLETPVVMWWCGVGFVVMWWPVGLCWIFSTLQRWDGINYAWLVFYKVSHFALLFLAVHTWSGWIGAGQPCLVHSGGLGRGQGGLDVQGLGTSKENKLNWIVLLINILICFTIIIIPSKEWSFRVMKHSLRSYTGLSHAILFILDLLRVLLTVNRYCNNIALLSSVSFVPSDSHTISCMLLYLLF